MGDGAGAEASRSSAFDGGGEFLRAIVVEERAEQPCDVDAERFAARGEALEQGGDDRDGEAQAVARARRIRLARRRDQATDMRLVLDDLTGIVAAHVARDLLGPGEHAHGRRTGEQRQRALP